MRSFPINVFMNTMNLSRASKREQSLDLRMSFSFFVDWMERLKANGTSFHSKPTSRLSAVISTHKACFAKLRERTVSASEDERIARSQIIAYEPRNCREALERLSYLFAVVTTAHDWLDDDEMEELLAMVRNINRAPYFVKLNQCLDTVPSVSSLISK